MMKKLLMLVVLVFPIISSAQIIYETVSSAKLQETREIKIQLPRNYEENKEKHYPVVVVLDGDYLFEPVAGIVDYYSYWENIPEMIVVGVNQAGLRNEDAGYDNERFLPADKGAAFFEFLGMELLKSMDEKYRTAPFQIIVGHDLTANFLNYYLLKPEPIFEGYISLSPDLAPEMANRITNILSKTESKRWYYMATGSEDIPQLKESILSLNNQINGLDNDLVFYKFDNFDNASHYSLVGRAIPSAIESIFNVYSPISQKEYNEVLLQTSISPSEYLIEKYKSIEELFGLEKQIRLNDFLAIHQAIEKTRRWEEYDELSKLASEHFPGTMLGTYFEARYEEETGNPKRAMKTYQNAYGQEKIAFLDVDFMLEKANAIKRDFGY
ncbi:alpha/beta hydrolase-fold protein [Salegentibacter sp. F188]|uniref:Alpha/beta hydrolase-fold protein n=1 Tax=Autumnicola patrickiae TaxID=3075591 RepID=A0ABU3E453_9FLAO|nr:alpha/beta hydrolase-fold protein [Salegentibacter sp. F188]MDT0690759.1 alpha/beta hydrolase-fold protein [Salegentibacter sp. F188]